MNILVTGSSRGIGKAIAKRFDEKGNNIIINSRNPDELERARREFVSCDYVEAVCADISVYGEAERVFEVAGKKIGGIDVLVNNAGVMHIGLFQDMSAEQWNGIIGVNINGMLNCTRLAVPYMIGMKKGVIINISSIWGERGASCEAVYALTKGGVNAFTKSLAKELGPCGIRVNAIACGVIETEMNGFLSGEERMALEEDIPLGRFGMACEVAELAFFLAGDGAAYLNGQIITLDGGFI